MRVDPDRWTWDDRRSCNGGDSDQIWQEAEAMILPRVRFTVRRMMIAVAVLAIGCGATRWMAEMRARSAAHRQRASEFYGFMFRVGSFSRTADGRSVDLSDNENKRLMDDWELRMVAKYLRLSYYPWLTAEPDPPPPRRLAHPRSALDLPKRDDSLARSVLAMRPPAWTFAWTWDGQW
jgi:hypothetical protein